MVSKFRTIISETGVLTLPEIYLGAVDEVGIMVWLFITGPGIVVVNSLCAGLVVTRKSCRPV